MMTDEELQDLEKEVKKLKRIATEWAGQVHDLVEERIPAGYRELPELTQGTIEACQAWEEANKRLKAAKA
jgi:hypothetical protein